jgi:hypothetical protein
LSQLTVINGNSFLGQHKSTKRTHASSRAQHAC